MFPLSILDLSPIPRGADAGAALRNTRDLAQHAERLGFDRFWLAEHHNMTGIASAATAVVIGHVAAGTRTIRVGAAGIMLPNHSPLVIAEQFGTLAALHPGRIDLGLGRAPGTDMRTAQALRRNLGGDVDDFPRDVVELQSYFKPARPGQPVQAVPGAGLEVPLWLLGSSLYGAQLAAILGLPYIFASHFAPDHLDEALAIYRAEFRPSEQLARPHAVAALNVFAADDAHDAARMATSLQQQFVSLRRGSPGQLPPPVDTMDGIWSSLEKMSTERALSCTVTGTADTVRDGLQRFIDRTAADEVVVTAQAFDHAARLRSFEIVAEVRAALRPATVAVAA